MAVEIKDGEMVLWPNDRRTQEKHPDYQGKARVDGVEKYVVLWVNTDRNGRTYLKGKLEVPRDQQPVSGPRTLTPTPIELDDGDRVPF